MVAYLRRRRRVRLVLAALCLGVVALFFHASYCQVSDVTVHPQTPASVTASSAAGHGGHEEGPEQCQHDEHAVLQHAVTTVHVPDSALLLLGLLALVTPALCLGPWERLRASWVVSPTRPVPLAGRGLLTQLCILRT